MRAETPETGSHHKRGEACFLEVQQSYHRMPSAPIIACLLAYASPCYCAEAGRQSEEQASPEPGGFETVRDEPGTRWAPGAIGDP
jgi:hypothetical protein